ncbi:MAG TPA: amino acid adenylation domain-containing protein, partial [Steroidobacter sp.]|uniref:amino acid adenylation domain-containing protein n=1 Tax=Steroidobacter sp. TaxID=1978227 RepID=UPI002EDAD23F
DHFKQLLTGMTNDVQARIGELPLLSEAERHRLLYEMNVTDAPYPQDRCVHQLFEAQVERTPEQVAVVFEGASLRYRELNERANRLAHYLRAQGVGPDCLVGICVERSLEMVVGVLGILKAGGAYVPLDPSYPKERLAYMLSDAAPKVLLTQRSLIGVLSEASVVLCLDAAEQALGAYPGTNPVPLAQPRHLAYVIYTSGSTGQPKGVMVEHRGLVNLAVVLQRSYELTSDDRLLQFAALGFDMSVEEIFGALCSGCTLILRSADWVGAAADFWKHCSLAAVSVVNLPTAYWAQLIGEDVPIPSCIRQIMVGGEEVKAEFIARWFERKESLPRLINAYGPTEASVNATIRVIDGVSAAARSIGRPIGNTRVHILDRRGEPVPLGVAGELHIGGIGVARGYLNRPRLTAEKFIVDRYGPNDSRLYKTGDLARYLPDGNIEYLGRNDDQVKIRGFRIELGEIEAALRAQPQVRDAVVLAREDAPGEKRLVAYVLALEQAGVPTSEQLRTALAVRLPEYMVPVAYVALDALPLTPNGKVDRKALPPPDVGAPIHRTYEPAVGDIEQALASIWCEVLRVQQVGRHDNFFELGGHSLLATQVVARIQRVLGRAIQVRDLFECPTVRELAGLWENTHRITLATIDRVNRKEPLPLSHMQQRLWFLSQLEGASAAYHMPGALRLQGSLDEAALRRALDRIVERHEVLRTVFEDSNGIPVQVVREAAHLSLPRLDVSALEERDREESVTQQAYEERHEPFNLRSGPLIRGRLLRLGAEEHVLFVTMHHIVSDGWSMGVLIRELSELYTAFAEGRSDPLPPLPLQYADYAAWQRRWLDGEALQARVAYWRDHLEGAPALLELPTDRARPAVQSYAGDNIEFSLGASLSAQLKSLARSHGVTLFMVLHAGLSVLLSRLSGERDVVIGSPVANRPRVELEELIGFFVNTLALRLRLEEDWSVATLLQQAKAVTLAGYAHQEVPFEQVVEVLQPPRSLSHSPIFQVLFVFQNTPPSTLQLGELQLQTQPLPHFTSQFDLSVSMEET